MPFTLLNILIILVVILLFFLAVLIFRSMIYGRLPENITPVEGIPVEAEAVAERLAATIRIQTISDFDRAKINYSTFKDLHAAIESMYPRVHATLKREAVNEYSLLYTWVGSDPELDPVLFAAHLDVVPFDPATREEWTHPPFAGTISDGFVWGRGALDTKSSVIAILEAIENLIKSGGYQPERTVYLAFGHDEEVGGKQGAASIAALLESRGVRLMAVLDEGGSIINGVLPGIDLPVALVGVSEKGHATLELCVEGRPGHSSAPPPHTAIGVLARAITRLEANPLPARLDMSVLTFDALGAFLPFNMRLMLANRWLFSGVLIRQLSKTPMIAAMLRTTTAATLIQGGIKDNILPAQARAAVNFRILPGDRVSDVSAHVRDTVKDDAVQINLPDFTYWEPSPVSPTTHSAEYQTLALAVREIFPEAVVAPYVVLGATDSRYYTILTNSVYRFCPYILNAEILKTIHGNDERIAINGMANMVKFYARVITHWTGGKNTR